MQAAEVVALIGEVFEQPVALGDGVVKLEVVGWEANGSAAIRAVLCDSAGSPTEVSEMEVQLRGDGASREQYSAFLNGMREAVGTLWERTGGVFPTDLFVTDLLSTTLSSAQEFGEAIADPDRAAALLSEPWLRAFEAQYELPRLEDSRTAALLWQLTRGQFGGDAELSAKRLAKQRDGAATPHVLRIVDGWYRRALELWGELDLTNRSRNDQRPHLAVARRLEPLAGQAAGEAERERFFALWEVGVFGRAGTKPRYPGAPTFLDLLQRLDAEVLAKAPRAHGLLQAPATEALQSQLLAALGDARVPPDLTAWFRWHDGARASASLHPFTALSPVGIERALQLRQTILRDSEGADPHWLPLFEAEDGGCLVYATRGDPPGELIPFEISEPGYAKLTDYVHHALFRWRQAPAQGRAATSPLRWERTEASAAVVPVGAALSVCTLGEDATDIWHVYVHQSSGRWRFGASSDPRHWETQAMAMALDPRSHALSTADLDARLTDLRESITTTPDRWRSDRQGTFLGTCPP